MVFELVLVIELGMNVEDIVLMIYLYLFFGEIVMDVLELVLGLLIYIWFE